MNFQELLKKHNDDRWSTWKDYISILHAKNDETAFYDESYWFEDDNPETGPYDSSYPINSLYRQIIFQLPIPKNGKIVVLGAGNGKTLDHLIEKFGEDRVIGYDLFNPTNHPNIEIFDCNDLDRVGIHNFDIALLHNDLGSWKRTPLLRERGYLWAKSKMVSGGWIVSDSNLTDDITIDIENLFKDYSCEYISKLPPKKYGDGFTQEANSSKYMVCQSPVVYKETPKVVDKIDLNFGFDYMGPYGPIPNGLAPRYVSEMIRHGGDPMPFFHERWNDLYNGECDHCGVIHQDPRPTTQRTAFFDIPYIETGYNLHFGSCSEFLKLPDTESNLRHSGDKSLNVNRPDREKFVYVVEPYGTPLNILGVIKDSPHHHGRTFVDFMSPGVLEQVQKGNCLLVISYIHEGYVENNSYGDGDGLFEFFDELHHVIDKNKIPPSQILFLISNHKLEEAYNSWAFGHPGYSQGSLHNFSYQKPINVMATNSELNITSQMFKTLKDGLRITKEKNELEQHEGYKKSVLLLNEISKDKKRKYHFITHNRNPRLHKHILMSMLLRDDNLDKGIVSLGGKSFPAWKEPMERLVKDSNKQKDLERYKQKLLEISPLVIEDSLKDALSDSHVHASSLSPQMLLKDSFQNAYFQIATESVYSNNDTMYLSEKVFKPMMYGLPFIYVGARHSLQMLKELGFRTFDKFIDESYDDVKDNYDRLESIAKEVDRLCGLSLEELHDLYHDNFDIIEHNYNHLLNYATNNNMHKQIFDKVYGILYE